MKYIKSWLNADGTGKYKEEQLFSNENLATRLEVNYQAANVAGYEKYVDFEFSDGTKATLPLLVDKTTEDILIIDMDDSLTIEGPTLIQPWATKLVESEVVKVYWDQIQVVLHYSINNTGEVAFENPDLIAELFETKISYNGQNSNIDTLTFDSTPTTTASLAEGQLRWNPTDHTLDIGLALGSTLQVGQESGIYVRNDSGTDILEGDAVYVSGVQGQTLAITKAIATSAATAYVIAVATTPIPKNGHGYVTTYGLVRGIDMNGWVEGQPLWLSTTTAGKYTGTQPATNYAQSFIGWVAKEGSNGSIFVFPKYLERSSEVPLTDLSNHFTATNVDTALEELYQTKASKTEMAAANLNKVDNITLTNLVANGDFSNGTTDWAAYAATMSVTSNTLTLTGNGVAATPYLTANIPGTGIANNKYYMRVEMRALDSACKDLAYFITGGVEDRVNYIQFPQMNTWYVIQGIITRRAGANPISTIVLRSNYADAATANGKKIEIRRVSIIDLTTKFGVGNEPTAAQMDMFYKYSTNNYISGTQKVINDSLLASALTTEKSIAKITYNRNKEVVVTAVDVATNTFTAANHGLTNGQIIYPCPNWGFMGFPYAVYAGGLTQVQHFVINANTNTFQVSLTSGGAAVDIVDNATMDLTKWHFEAMITGWSNASMGFNGLNGKKYKVVYVGSTLGNSVGYPYVVFATTKDTVGNMLSNNSFGYSYINMGAYMAHMTFIYDNTDPNIFRMTYDGILFLPATKTTLTTNTIDFDAISTDPLIVNQNIVNMYFTSNQWHFRNGTTLEVYEI